MATVLLAIYEGGVVLRYGDRVHIEELPPGWIDPISINTAVLKGALRRAERALNYQKASYEVLLFSEFLYYSPEIKDHMHPTREEVMRVVEEKLSSFYPAYSAGSAALVYSAGSNGLHAAAVSNEVLEEITKLLKGPTRFYSGHLALYHLVAAFTSGYPRVLAFWREGGTAIGLSLATGELYAINRIPSLEGEDLEAALRAGDEGKISGLQTRIEEEIGNLLPLGIGDITLVLGGEGRRVFESLRLGIPHTVMDLQEAWRSPGAERQRALYASMGGVAPRSSFSSYLLPMILGALA